MPNWVSNNLTASKHVVESLLVTTAEGNDYVEFNNIVPRPDIVRNITGNGKGYKRFNKDGSVNANSTALTPEEIEFYKNLFGPHIDWYEWALHNWGTKWTKLPVLYKTNESDNIMRIRFETAWSLPHEFYLKLSEVFPKDRIIVEFEEEMDSFSGTHIYKGGELIEEI